MDHSEPDDVDLEGRQMVRRYTDELNGANELEIAVQRYPIVVEKPRDTTTSIRRPNKTLYQDSDEKARIFDDAEIQRERLREAWSTFQQKLHNKPSKKSRRFFSKKPTTTARLDDHLQDTVVDDWQDVWNTVKDYESDWVMKDRLLGGKVQSTFHKVCQTLDSHNAVFDFFPSQNEYVAVLCGSLKMLIQASVYHLKIAEEFSRAWKEVSDHVINVDLIVDIMNTEDMRRLISSLYAQIFEFLRFAMEWWSSNSSSKFGNAFNQGLYDSLKERVVGIQKSCGNIRARAQACGLAEARDIRLTGEDTYNVAQMTLSVVQSHGAIAQNNGASLSRLSESNLALVRENEMLLEQRRLENERWERRLGLLEDQAQVAFKLNSALLDIFNNNKIITATTERQVDLLQISSSAESSSSDGGGYISESSENPSLIEQTFLKSEVLESSAHLEDFIIGYENRDIMNSLPTFAESLVVTKLQLWIAAPTSHLLWIIGPKDHLSPSNMSFASGSMISAATKLELPLISHLCRLPRYGDPTNSHSREEDALIGLLYDLILQLIEQMAPDIEAGIDLSAKRFELLDGSMDTWDNALDLFQGLLRCFPMPLLLCVIDGLSIVDLGPGAWACAELLEVLRDHYATSDNTFKILLTTSGTSGMQGSMEKVISFDKRHYAVQANDRNIFPNGSRPLDLLARSFEDFSHR